MLARFPFLQSLCKWLIITLVVITGLFVVLLGLGYLLRENEQETRQLKEQLDAEKHKQQGGNKTLLRQGANTPKDLHNQSLIELTPIEDVGHTDSDNQSEEQPNPQ